MPLQHMEMKAIARHIILTLLMLLAAACSVAQTFDNIAMGDAATVCAIAQDEQGVMWMGTDHGLYSFDGYRSTAHCSDHSGKTVCTRIHSMAIVRGTIYLGTERGLMAYDIRRGQYVSDCPAKDTDIRAVGVWNGRLWFGGAHGLYCGDGARMDMKAVNTKLHNVYSILPTRQGLLVGTLDGLWLVDKRGKQRRVNIGKGRQPLVNALLADGKSVWIGTEGALYRYDGKEMTPTKALDGNSVKSLALQADDLYVGTDNGLYIYNKVTHALRHAVHDSRSTRSIANNIVWSVMADRWGNVWTGTDQGMSAIYKQPFFCVTPLADIVGTGDGNCLHLIVRGTGNMMWLGGTNGLVGYTASHGFMPDPGASIAWYRQNSTDHYMSHNRVRRVYTDSDGTTIICTDHGLNIYDPQTRKLRNVIVTDASRRYTTAWAYDIVDDGRGRYWICSYMGGVFVVDKTRLLTEDGPTIVADRHLLAELQGIHVWQLVKDGKGRIWTRMYDHGLDRIDPATMRVEHVVGNDRLINDMCADHEGNVWAAMDGEIRCFGMTAKSNRSLKLYNTNESATLLCEADGNIWAVIGQDCCILGSEGASARFSLAGLQPLAMGYDRLSKIMLLGGNDFVLGIPTQRVSTCFREAAHGDMARGDGSARRQFFLLSGILVDGKAFVPKEGCPTYLTDLTLTARQNNVTFQFSDLPMAGNQHNVYAYRLEGIDHSWQYAHNLRQDITYNALPPGSYTLEVRTVSGLGEAQHEVYSLRVRVLPPWYLSVWAKLVYALILVALAVWIFNFYMMRRRLREERMAKKQIMQESAARSQFFDNLSSQLRHPIGSLLASLLAMLRDEKDSNDAQRLDTMRRNVNGINSLVFKAFDMTRCEDGNDMTERSVVDIVDFCRRATDDARARHGKATDFAFHTDTPYAYAEVDIAHLQPVTEMLLDFAASYATDDRGVTIDVATANNDLSLKIGIPGMSIAKEELPLAFNRYFSVANDRRSTAATTNTLALADEFAKQNNAVARIECEGEYVVVEIDMAIKRKAVVATSSATVSPTAEVSRPSSMPKQDSADAHLLTEITDAIEQHIADSDFNVTRLQETLGVGSKLLYRKLKQMTGKTPVEFIRHVRMQRAALLLREGKFSVSEVMYMVGFSNSSYFSKMFQKTYGITPTDYSRGQGA